MSTNRSCWLEKGWQHANLSSWCPLAWFALVQWMYLAKPWDSYKGCSSAKRGRPFLELQERC